MDKGKAEAAGFEAAGRPGDGYIHITGELSLFTRSGPRANRLKSGPTVMIKLNRPDERALPPAGRIGETEDLIGSVFVEDGKVRSTILSHKTSTHVLDRSIYI